jgi:hypothetical protein
MKKIAISAVTALLVLAGCVSSSRARKVTPSDFLGESASRLKKGSKDDVLLVYRNKNADWPSYDKIIVDPISILGVKGRPLPPDQLADFQKLVDDFYRTLRDRLSKDYAMTDGPAAGTIRIQIAILNGKPAKASLKVVTTVAPYAGSADTLWTFVTGKPAFAGEVSIEYMISDSQSQELLAAGADRRVGGNQLGKATLSSWGDVRNIFEYWSDQAVYLLCVDRKAAGCTQPKAGLVKNPVM